MCTEKCKNHGVRLHKLSQSEDTQVTATKEKKQTTSAQSPPVLPPIQSAHLESFLFRPFPSQLCPSPIFSSALLISRASQTSRRSGRGGGRDGGNFLRLLCLLEQHDLWIQAHQDLDLSPSAHSLCASGET